MEDYKNYLKTFECHFNWDLKDIMVIKNVKKCLLNKRYELGGWQPWLDSLLWLTTSYECFIGKELIEADEYLKKCIELYENCDDKFLQKYKKSFQHVIFGFKANFIVETSSLSDCEMSEILSSIPAYSELSSEEKAAIKGIKANIYKEYGSIGTNYALNFAKEAIAENSAEWEWSLLTGSLLFRIRHFTRDNGITKEEMKYFEDAYFRSRCVYSTVFLAAAYQDAAYCLKYNKLIPFLYNTHTTSIGYTRKQKLFHYYTEQSLKLFREALVKNENRCPHTMIRCARGLFGFRNYTGTSSNQTVEEALHITRIALELAPDNIGAHLLAASIYFHLKKVELGFLHAYAAEKQGCYGSAKMIFFKRVTLNMDVDSEETFAYLLKTYNIPVYVANTYTTAIAYYLTRKNNHLSSALKYFFKAAEMKLKADDFVGFQDFYYSSLDLCKRLYTEVKGALATKKYNNMDEHSQLLQAMDIFRTLYPHVLE